MKWRVTLAITDPQPSATTRPLHAILTIKWGHLLRFDPTEIEAWIDQNRREVRPPLR
jgi:hypothetical protein